MGHPKGCYCQEECQEQLPKQIGQCHIYVVAYKTLSNNLTLTKAQIIKNLDQK